MPPSLPTELLKTIFRYATSANADLHPEITHAPKDDAHSGWFIKFENDNLEKMGTKIALTRVSHRFRRISLEFLYEFVSIDKPHQAERLVEVMKKQSSSNELRPREWIRFLFVRRTSARIVTGILGLCRGLRGFSWDPTSHLWSSRNWSDAQDEMIKNIPTNLRFLHWDSVVSQYHAKAFAEFLQKASASLQILYVGRVELFPISSYPSLTHLQVEHQCPFDALDRWTLPSLIDLHLIVGYALSGPKLFPNVGKTLRVLRCDTSPLFDLHRLLPHIFSTCPNLEEMSYHLNSGMIGRISPWESDATHMKLKKIVVGVCLSFHDRMDAVHSKLQEEFRPISLTRFPMLDEIIVDDVSRTPLIPNCTKFLVQKTSGDFGSAVLVPYGRPY